MKKLCIIAVGCLLMAACSTKNSSAKIIPDAGGKDTTTYPYKASYSSDISAPGNPAIAKRVLEVWRAFEAGQIQSKRSYFADQVSYSSANGFQFTGSADTLLAIASKETNSLDSLRFDISTWDCVHVNDRNEDWVNIWATERQYPKTGRPDTFLTQENWKVLNGKIVSFNQYTAKLRR